MTEQHVDAQAGAVSALFAERRGQLVGYARKRLAALDVPPAWVDAEDVVHSAFASVLAHSEPIGKLRPYVFSVVRNEAWHAAQRYRAGHPYGRLDADVQLETAAAMPDGCGAVETRLDFEAALDRLPPQQRTAVLYRMLGLTQAETAQAMGKAPGTVAGHTSRAIITLRATLAAMALTVAAVTAAWLQGGTTPIDPAAGGQAWRWLRSSPATAAGVITTLVLVWLATRPLTAAALGRLWQLLVVQPAQRLAVWLRSSQATPPDPAAAHPPGEPRRTTARSGGYGSYGRGDGIHDMD